MSVRKQIELVILVIDKIMMPSRRKLCQNYIWKTVLAKLTGLEMFNEGDPSRFLNSKLTMKLPSTETILASL